MGSVLSRVQNSGRALHGPVLVHRLDMDTSGLMVLAKNRHTHRALQQQFENRQIRKRYRAVLESPVDALGGRICLPIRLDIDNRPKQIVCDVHGKPSTTLWHRTDARDERSITLYPLTGRTHQLRVHASAAQGLGIAISGDRLYGAANSGGQNSCVLPSVSINRLLLHADFLNLSTPIHRGYALYIAPHLFSHLLHEREFEFVMKSFAIAYGAAVIAFMVLDGIWLGVLAKSFYAEQLGQLLRKNFLPAPAIAFYLLYTAGLVYLAVRPGQADISLGSIALYGAIVGFLAYGTYDMTNLATLRDWPWLVSVVDLAWGTVLSATVATVAALVLRQFN